MSELQRQNGVDRDRLMVVFRKRAQTLAQQKRGYVRSDAHLHVIVFRQGSDRFGIELAHIKQVFQRVPITVVPGAAKYVVGVASLNGTLHSVISLGPLQELAPAGHVDSVILVRAAGKMIGIGAQAIEDSCQIGTDMLTPVDGIGSAVSSKFTRGMTVDRVIVLDAEQLIEHLLNGRHTDAGANGWPDYQPSIDAN